MAVAGIIAEYNPFHRGHGWQLSALRGQLGQDTEVVAVMSGNFVQRGDLAVMDKHARAEAALRCGVDLVLELPTPWSCSTAERFAQGGAAILAATGVVTHLVFGSECGDLDALWAAALCLDGEEYPLVLRRLLATGMSFAAARQEAVAQLSGDAARCLSQPNDNLAVEYLRALSRVDGAGGIEPVTFRRVGAAHDSAEPGAYASASYIRGLVLAGDPTCLLYTSRAGFDESTANSGFLPLGGRKVLVRLDGKVFEADLDKDNDLPAEIDALIYTILVNYAYLLG